MRPKEPHEVFVAATHSLITGYNNLSTMPEWLSDTICVVSEGSGESRRELFSDADESLIVARAPFLLTGIENVIKRGDLAQRTLYIHLASVPDGERITEQVFKARFKRAHADLLGAVCAAASVGLRREGTLKLDALPRLATFYHWASACEPALWRRDEFRIAYAANAGDATEDVIEAEMVASTLRRFMAEQGKWKGTATDLLAELVAFVRRPVREAEAAHAQAVRDKNDAEREKTAAILREARETARDTLGDRWPKAPNALSGKLKRVSPALRVAGVWIEWPTDHSKAKIIKIETVTSERNGETSSWPSDRPGQSNDVNGLAQNVDQESVRLGRKSGNSGRSPDGPQAGRSFEGRTIPEQPPPETSSADTPLNSGKNRTANLPDDDSGTLSDMVVRIVEKFDQLGFRVVLTPESAVVIQDLYRSGRKWSREAPPDLMAELNANADAVARWIEQGGTI
jgi:hypothetical protein